MGEAVELRDRVVAYLQTVSKAKSREVAEALDVKKSEVDKVVKVLALEDVIEFLYLGTSYIRIKGKED